MIFNGEIYNFIELRKSLIEKGENLPQSSIRRFSLRYYKLHKERCVEYFKECGFLQFMIKKKIFL